MTMSCIEMSYTRTIAHCQVLNCPIHDLQQVYMKLSGIIYMTYSRYGITQEVQWPFDLPYILHACSKPMLCLVSQPTMVVNPSIVPVTLMTQWCLNVYLLQHNRISMYLKFLGTDLQVYMLSCMQRVYMYLTSPVVFPLWLPYTISPLVTCKPQCG